MIRRDLILGRRINNPSARFSIPLDCIRPLFILFISHGRELHSLKKNKMVHSRSELQGNSEFSVNDMLHRKQFARLRESAETSILVPRLLDVKQREDRLDKFQIVEAYGDFSMANDDRGFRSKIVPINGGSIFTPIERYVIPFEPRGIDPIFERCPCIEVPGEFCETSYKLPKTCGCRCP